MIDIENQLIIFCVIVISIRMTVFSNEASFVVIIFDMNSFQVDLVVSHSAVILEMISCSLKMFVIYQSCISGNTSTYSYRMNGYVTCVFCGDDGVIILIIYLFISDSARSCNVCSQHSE